MLDYIGIEKVSFQKSVWHTPVQNKIKTPPGSGIWSLNREIHIKIWERKKHLLLNKTNDRLSTTDQYNNVFTHPRPVTRGIVAQLKIVFNYVIYRITP